MTVISLSLSLYVSSCHKFDSAAHSGYSEWWLEQTLEWIPQRPQHSA